MAAGTSGAVVYAAVTGPAAAQPRPIANRAHAPAVVLGTVPTWAPTTTTSTPPQPRVARPAPAPAPVPARTLQQRGEDALRRITYPYQQLGYRIDFLPGAPGYLGRGFHLERRIEVYVRNNQSDQELAHVVAHEIGHAVDWLYHNDSRDQQWLVLRGVDPSMQWAPPPFAPDFGYPSGDFAEVFAYWQLGDAFHGTLAPRPTADQLQQLSKLFSP